MALTEALGFRKAARQNWTCCHIWGVDDPTFQLVNNVVKDYRFFSCVGNMVLLPTPLKAFTDSMPQVKTMLRVCAASLYGWECDHESLEAARQALKDWNDWEAYPQSWPRSFDDKKLPLGAVSLSSRVEQKALARMAAVKTEMKQAGAFYPRTKVIAAVNYWKEQLSSNRRGSKSFLDWADDLMDAALECGVNV